MRRHGRCSDALQQDAFGILHIHAGEFAVVVLQGREGANPAKVRSNDNEAGRGGETSVVRRREFHLQFCAATLLATKIVGDGTLDVRFRDDDEMPGLGIGARWRVACRFENEIVMLVRDLANRIERAGRDAVSHDLHQGVIGIAVINRYF